MADITITAANVAGTSNSVARLVQAGETMTQGKACYLKSSDQKYWLADANAEATAEVIGVALTPAAADGYFYLQTSGNLIAGGTVAVGQTYVLSETAGGIAVESDIGTGVYVTIIGIGISTTQIALDIQISGITHA